VRLGVFVTVAAVGAAACSGKGANENKRKEECKGQVAELDRFLHAMNHEGQVLSIDGVELAMRPDIRGSRWAEAPAVTVLPGKIIYNRDGQTAVTLEQLGERLAADRAKRAALPPQRGGNDLLANGLYLIVDARVPWSDVVAVVARAGSTGYSTIRFVFGQPSPVAPPPRAPIDDRLDAIQHGDPSRWTTDLATEMRNVVASCKPLTRAFGSVTYEADDKALALIDATAPAVLECDCNIDIPAFRSLMWRFVGNAHPTVFAEVSLSPSAQPVVHPASMPWSEAARDIAAGSAFWPRATP
jgi:hypothetical protein